MCPDATVPNPTNIYNALFPTTATVKYTTLPLSPAVPIQVTEGAANAWGADAVISAATAADLWLTDIYVGNFSAAGSFTFQVQDDGVSIWTGGQAGLLGAAGGTTFYAHTYPLFIALGSNIDCNMASVAGGAAITADVRLGFLTANFGVT